MELEKNNKSKFQEQLDALSRINIDLRWLSGIYMVRNLVCKWNLTDNQ